MINCFKDSIHVLMTVLLCKIFSALFLSVSSVTPILLSLIRGKFAEVENLLVSATNDDDDDHDEEAVNHVDGHRIDEVREEVHAKEDEGHIGGVTTTLALKSSLRKADSNSTDAVKKEKKKKKKVQWVDVIGKELAEIREFEPSEEDDIDSDRGKTCVCVIL